MILNQIDKIFTVCVLDDKELNKIHYVDGHDSQLKQAAEAIRRENERIETENRRKDKEIAYLLKKIQNAKKL